MTKDDWRYFFESFAERLNFVKVNCIERIEGIILLCCYIDSLSGYVYGGKSNKQRFINLLENFSNNKNEWEKVSLPLLKRYLLEKSDICSPNFIAFLDKKIGTGLFLNELDYNPDVEFDEIIKNYKNDNVREIMSIIEDYKYSSILWYNYRNPSVHNIAVYNRPLNILGKTIPFYVNETIECNGLEFIPRFESPPKFIFKELNDILDNLKSYVNENDVNCIPFLNDKKNLK